MSFERLEGLHSRQRNGPVVRVGSPQIAQVQGTISANVRRSRSARKRPSREARAEIGAEAAHRLAEDTLGWVGDNLVRRFLIAYVGDSERPARVRPNVPGLQDNLS